MPRQLSDSAHCYLEYYGRRHLVTCHPRFSYMWWLDKYWGTGLKTTKWNLSFHDLMSTRSFVINHEQCSWKFDENTNYGDMRPIKKFYELWLWRFCDKTTVKTWLSKLWKKLNFFFKFEFLKEINRIHNNNKQRMIKYGNK